MSTNPFRKLELRTAWYVFAACLAVFAYFYGLDSQYAPRNGDELVYAHITRLTAESGHLLPLRSELNSMRNTKPPLLFWQGILSTDWGREWDLWHLRFPGVIYTLLTAVLIFLLTRRIAKQSEAGFLAALAFLAFFSTYRFGRPYLTNPPEVFWLFLPFFFFLYLGRAAVESRFLFPAAGGTAIGIGLLYKSFALVAPVCAGLAWWMLHERRYRLGSFLLRDAWKLALAALLALGIFCLWFALDPDPQAVLKEFVLGENMGKMTPQGGSYVKGLLWGGSSVWALAGGFLSDTGLLIFPFVSLIFLAAARRGRMEEPEKLLWIWILTQFVFFSLPSQRSGRYLLDAMPAVAVLLALNWERIPRAAFILSLACSGLAAAGIGYLSLRLAMETGGGMLYPAVYWLLPCGTVILAAAAIALRRLTRPVVPVAVLLVFLSFAAFLRPFDGASGNFSEEAQRYAKGRDVWVPCNFRAKDEGHRFVLPGALVHGYTEKGAPDLAAAASRFPLFAFRMPLSRVPDRPGCTVVGERLVIRSRHSNRELKEMILHGRVMQHFFAREYLIESSEAGSTPPRDECR
ncbi:MAG: phospholipid carrier-dependent glycosyltransferase [Syntrophobacteraceae bacterium]|nr:phospholipid carrier-dependent glycosyltransferase [Desulfobacteraceae bacterium]